jgi:hypothetical protein
MAAVEEWIRGHVTPTEPLDVVHERPWSEVARVPVADGAVWFKACAPVQEFEPRLTHELAQRWPDRVVRVIAHDEERAWLLLGDGGTPLAAFGDVFDAWLAVLPLYAELQRNEAPRADEHLAGGVPDQRLERLPELFEAALDRGLPLEPDQLVHLRSFLPRLAELSAELDARGIPATVQHDDLHDANVYARDGRFAILDWGDTSISHPFITLLVTVRLFENTRSFEPGGPWVARLRDAYLEPWGSGHEDTFALAQRVGHFAHTLTWLRVLDSIPEDERGPYEEPIPRVLQRLLAAAGYKE